MQRILASKQTKTFSRVNPLSIPIFICALIPPILVFIFVFSFAQKVPLGDQWYHQREIAVAVKDGTLTFANLLKPFNDQRHITETLTVAILTFLTNWNIKLQAFVNIGLDCIALLVVFDIF